MSVRRDPRKRPVARADEPAEPPPPEPLPHPEDPEPQELKRREV